MYIPTKISSHHLTCSTSPPPLFSILGIFTRKQKKAMDYTSHETGHEFAKLKCTKREIVCVLVFECVKNRLITRTTLSFSTRNLSSGGGGVLISPFLPSKIITWKYLITGHRSRNSLAFVVHRRTKVMCNKLTVHHLFPPSTYTHTSSYLRRSVGRELVG